MEEMTPRPLAALLVLLITAAPPSAGARTEAPAGVPVLRAYGPGGPLGPMKECAEIFSRERGVRVEVTAGPEASWIEKARTDADLVFGGAEYMLTSFAAKHPGLLDEATRDEIAPRPAGILVRKGNPKRIRSLRDLARPGVRLVDVNGAGQLGLWEDLAGRQGLIPGIRRNIAVSTSTSAEAIERWTADPGLDAWITFASWHHRLVEVTDLVRLPDSQTLDRGTPIALAARTGARALALEFVAFLKGPRGRAVFRKWGWR